MPGGFMSARRKAWAKKRQVENTNVGSTDEHDPKSILGKLSQKSNSETLKKVKKITSGKERRYA